MLQGMHTSVVWVEGPQVEEWSMPSIAPVAYGPDYIDTTRRPPDAVSLT